MIFVVPFRLKICVEPVEFVDGKFLEPRNTVELTATLQPITAESEIVKTSFFKMSRLDSFAGLTTCFQVL